jgi:hypothetical protein
LLILLLALNVNRDTPCQSPHILTFSGPIACGTVGQEYALTVAWLARIRPDPEKNKLNSDTNWVKNLAAVHLASVIFAYV